MFKSRILALLLLPVIAIGLLFAGRQPLLTRIGAFPVVADELDDVDLIVVISGALPEVHYGIDLYQQGLAPRILFVGHFPVELAVISEEPFAVTEESWEVVAKHLATNAGVDADDILLSEAFTNSTYERVQSIATTAKSVGAESAIVVTDPMHARRVAFSADKILGEDGPGWRMAPTPGSYYPEAYRYDPTTWWSDEEEIKEVFGEYLKLAFYWLKY